LTDKVAGQKKGIIDDPIKLTITSASCPDLTLVDLPGIAKVAIRGSDQSEDIETVTKEMCAR
jgi:replication fork clamp-binding protein CrfC